MKTIVLGVYVGVLVFWEATISSRRISASLALAAVAAATATTARGECNRHHVTYSLNSLKESDIKDYIGDYYRGYQGG